MAVSEGTLYRVGWNHAAGNKLWLRDGQGNEFLYTHLSAFSKLASNGAHVRAGQVIGFMGSTGTSAGPRVRLYFEVHPVSMLFLGQDGAVDPAPYLGSWRHLASLALPVGAVLGAEGARDDQRPGARGGADRVERHLDRRRARPGVAAPGRSSQGKRMTASGRSCRASGRDLRVRRRPRTCP